MASSAAILTAVSASAASAAADTKQKDSDSKAVVFSAPVIIDRHIPTPSVAPKKLIDLKTLPPQVDFWTPDNVLVTSLGCNFPYYLQGLKNRYHYELRNLELDIKIHNQDEYDPWARDVFSLKTADTIYAMNQDVILQPIVSDKKNTADQNHAASIRIATENCYVTQSALFNHGTLPSTLNTAGRINVQPSPIAAHGGNFFHCVNAAEKPKPYVIVGELALLTKDQVQQNQKLDVNSAVGAKSSTKYPNQFNDRETMIATRKLNKQILRKIYGDTKVVIVPNLFYHIDIQMVVLPNGFVLLHSHEETLRVVQEKKKEMTAVCHVGFNGEHIDVMSHRVHKDNSPIPVQYNYDDVYNSVKKSAEDKTYQYLFNKCRDKLTKRGFVVIPVCGLLEYDKAIFALGFNGLPIVLPDGKILYTMPENDKWYRDYFLDVLTNKAGVSIVDYITDKDRDYFGRAHGFFRCQTNTIPKALVKDQQAARTCTIL